MTMAVRVACCSRTWIQSKAVEKGPVSSRGSVMVASGPTMISLSCLGSGLVGLSRAVSQMNT
jgi:hypothetical protein